MSGVYQSAATRSAQAIQLRRKEDPRGDARQHSLGPNRPAASRIGGGERGPRVSGGHLSSPQRAMRSRARQGVEKSVQGTPGAGVACNKRRGRGEGGVTYVLRVC